MNKYAVALLIAVIPVWLFIYFIADHEQKFNPELETVLLETLHTKKLSKTQFSTLQSLDLSNRQLVSIEGLENFVNLKELNLADNLITDASPIAKLEHLEKLDLRNNQLSGLDLTAAQLKSLRLDGNHIVSIEFARSLKKLTNLNLRENKVSDLSPLEDLKKLKALNIRDNQVKTLEPLGHLKHLQDLNVRHNQVRSVASIANLPLEKRLYISGNDIYDLNELEPVIQRTDDYDFEISLPVATALTPSGIYKEPFDLELRTAKKHRMFYTLDGTIPTLHSKEYDGPIKINQETLLEQPLYSNYQTTPLQSPFNFKPEEVKKAITVTAVSVVDGKFSKPANFTYILDPQLAEANLPIVSLTVDPESLFEDKRGIYVPGMLFEEGYNGTGNYYGRGREYEREGAFEYFNSDGTLTVSQRLGIRTHGSYTRRMAQKSLRLYARSEYGQSRFYMKFFEELPYHEYKVLILRNSGNDNVSTMLRDGFMQELVKDRSFDTQAYQPTIVLLNGEYWGIQNLRERYNAEYIDTNYHVKPDELAMISFKPGHHIAFNIEEGTEKDQQPFLELIQWIRDHDLSLDDNLAMIDERIDIKNFFEYVSAQVYFANTDSFNNNLQMWRKKINTNLEGPYGHDGRWRWMMYDLDWGMRYGLREREGEPVEFNMLEYMTRDHESVFLFQELMENKKMKNQFTLTLLDMLDTNFESQKVISVLDKMAENIRPAMPESIHRWNNIESMEQWEDNLETMRRFAEERPAIVRGHLQQTFGYTAEELDRLKQ
ncbi:CotH kinase family protein [Sporosarcina sp.]|uniref:CotH kinase family protein n=1 Tax=Sporosarcina sp. TaxID=49982 RepID=UPI0026246C71|nr:CotH kinase family protein [Sporosarcina sp.]